MKAWRQNRCILGRKYLVLAASVSNKTPFFSPVADGEFSRMAAEQSLPQPSKDVLVSIDNSVIRKIQCADSCSWGFLLGNGEDGTFYVIEAIRCPENFNLLNDRDGNTSRIQIDKMINQLLVHLPKGVDIIGAFYFRETLKKQVCKFFEQNTESFGNTRRQKSFLIYRSTQKGEFYADLLELENGSSHANTNVNVVYSDSVANNWKKNTTLFQLKATIPCQINIGNTNFSVDKECQRVLSKLRNSSIALIAEDAGVIITKSQFDMSLASILDGISSSAESGHAIELKLLKSLCENDQLDDDIFCPVLMFDSSPEEILELTLDLDTIMLLNKSIKVEDFIAVCVDSLCIQVKYIILSTVKSNSECLYSEMKAYHFSLENSNLPITMVYPLSEVSGKTISEDDLLHLRKTAHEMFFLPEKRPLLMKHQNYFSDLKSAYLINPHTNLKSGIENGICAIVDGKYAYHHYMQDYFNDNGWGCAYRSLQTICSWFKLQGFVTCNVPGHKEIQEALVAVGDKQKSFIGSRQWIGSFEVSICLEKLLNISSKILHVSCGAEMALKGRELLDHFKRQGTPIMIGGGVLAHTILGVHFDELSGDIKFLILDPHYTGAENIKVIQDKGWCGWKGPKFWDQVAHYNMCLPQKPTKI